MSERLRPGDFDEIASMTWDLARLTMADLLQIAPIDSQVKGEIHVDNYCVEPEVFVEDPLTVMLDTLPRNLVLSVSEKEPYRGNDSLTMYTYKTLRMDTQTRRKAFSQNITVLDNEGRTITLESSNVKPAFLSAKERGVWQSSVDKSLLAFGHHDATAFLRIADLALQSLTSRE